MAASLQVSRFGIGLICLPSSIPPRTRMFPPLRFPPSAAPPHHTKSLPVLLHMLYTGCRHPAPHPLRPGTEDTRCPLVGAAGSSGGGKGGPAGGQGGRWHE